MDKPANDNQQPVPEAGTADSVVAEADTPQRAPTVADIPTVAPSQRPGALSDAGGDAADPAAGEMQGAAKSDASPAPAPGDEAGAAAGDNVAAPVLEAAIWHRSDPEPSAEGPDAPFFLKERDTTAEPSQKETAPDLAPPATSPAEPPNAAADASAPRADDREGDADDRAARSAAPICEEQIWSGPDASATHVEATAEAMSAERTPTSDGAGHRQPHPETEPKADEAPAASTRAIPSVSGLAAAGWLGYLRRAAVVAAAAMVTLVVGVLLLILAYRWIDPPISTLMLGQRLAGVRIEQTWVPLDRISPNLMHAVILSEDGSFCRHRGVDWPALTQAIEDDRGGSTITMQVVKNLFLWPSRSYVRKGLEILLAYLVEAVWPKHRVLEIYLNIAEWGPGIFGAEAAAQNHFGKPAARLTAQEAALLAVALPSPLERESGYPGTQQRRLASNLLTRMRAVRTRSCVPMRRGAS